MYRVFAAVFALSLLFAAPAYAQISIQDQVSAQLVEDGVVPADATQTQVDAALNTVLTDAIAASLPDGVIPTSATSEQMAAAVSSILTNNPNLSTGSVAALANAAIRAVPGSASDVTRVAVILRPNDAVQITRAATAANPTRAEDVAEGAGLGMSNATDAELAAIVANINDAAEAAGVALGANDILLAVARNAGRNPANIIAALSDAVVVADARVTNVEDVEDDDEENPAQDDEESPS